MVAFIAKVEVVVQEIFLETPMCFAPAIKDPCGATDSVWSNCKQNVIFGPLLASRYRCGLNGTIYIALFDSYCSVFLPLLVNKTLPKNSYLTSKWNDKCFSQPWSIDWSINFVSKEKGLASLLDCCFNSSVELVPQFQIMNILA